MKSKITSLNCISITPESDEEKLIMDSWHGSQAIVSPTINNAGLNYPERYISYTISFHDSRLEEVKG